MFVVCPHVGTPCLISEGPSEAYLSLVLWQPDIYPHSLLTHEKMRALPSTKWPKEYLGIGEFVFYCKLGLGTETFPFFCRAQPVLYQNLRATSSSPQLSRAGKKAYKSNLWYWLWESNLIVSWVTLKALSLGPYSAQQRHLLSQVTGSLSSAAPFFHIM